LDLWHRVPVYFAGFFQYGRLLLLPVGLHMEYSPAAFGLTDPRVIGGAVGAFLLIILALLKRKTQPGFFFATGWFFIAFLPVSNIYPISYASIMEHYLYLPALGFFIIVAGIFCHPVKSKTAVFILRLAMVSLLIFYAYLTFKQAGYWKDPVVFYKRTLQYAPGSWRFYNELGLEYAASGSSLEAEKAYQEAIRINPDALGIYANLAGLYQKPADQKKLLATKQLADQAKAKLLRRHLEMASRFQAAESYEQAAAELKAGLGFSPGNLIIAQDLANLYVLMGRYKDAVGLFTEILTIRPDFALAYNNLAVAYYYLKQYDLAVDNCDKALTLGYQVQPEFIKLLKAHRK
jgi:tetratricopeptide (TPR) repeat protein